MGGIILDRDGEERKAGGDGCVFVCWIRFAVLILFASSAGLHMGLKLWDVL